MALKQILHRIDKLLDKFLRKRGCEMQVGTCKSEEGKMEEVSFEEKHDPYLFVKEREKVILALRQIGYKVNRRMKKNFDESGFSAFIGAIRRGKTIDRDRLRK